MTLIFCAIALHISYLTLCFDTIEDRENAFEILLFR